jgi:2-methylcitrate dehydratase PrpD
VPETLELAEFTSTLVFEGIPQAVRQRAKSCILDQLGVQLASSTLPWSRGFYETFRVGPGKQESTIVKYGDRVSPAQASIVNGTFGHGAELDDVCGGFGHPGSVIIPAAMALGESGHIDGKELVAAIIAGYEVAIRVANAVMPSLRSRGFHVHACSTFGAAAAAARILKLDAEATAHAFGFAGSYSSGLNQFEFSGGDVKRLHAGMAARGGVESALLAKKGMTAPTDILEGEKGFCRAFADKYDLSLLTRGVGSEFKILTVGFKLYPTPGRCQAPISIISKLAEEFDLHPDDIDQISVESGTKIKIHPGLFEPQDVLSAQFNVPFNIALRLKFGRNDLTDYIDEEIRNDGEIVSLAKKVKLTFSEKRESIVPYSTEVRVKLKSGKTHVGSQDFPKGTTKNPFTDNEFHEKFGRLSGPVIGKTASRAVVQQVEKLDRLDDVSEIMKYLVA